MCLMCENAKEYYGNDSRISRDAIALLVRYHYNILLPNSYNIVGGTWNLSRS